MLSVGLESPTYVIVFLADIIETDVPPERGGESGMNV
jgi:hypothetical protein